MNTYSRTITGAFFHTIVLLMFFLSFLPCVNAHTEEDLIKEHKSIINNIAPAVVTVRVSLHGYEQAILGSGFFVKKEGGNYYIVTNKHVAQGNDRRIIKIEMMSSAKYSIETHDGKIWPAKITFVSGDKDIAILQIAAEKGKEMPNYPIPSFGSAKELEAMDMVCAYGSPFALVKTTTCGIINRTPEGETIVHSALLNPGNSGGVLIRMSGMPSNKGKIVGMTTAIFTNGPGVNSNLGIAIEIGTILEFVKKALAS